MGLLEQQNDSLLPVTANPKLLAQALKARQQPRTQLTGQGLLDTAAIGLSPVPVIGDALGLAADASRFYNEPESRTPLNFGLAALGVIPFVPPLVSAGLGKFAQSQGKTLAQTPTGPARNQAGAIVYHGSPHKFDQFDSSKIGTGEGAQAYGHGLYFAENPNVAQTYIPPSDVGVSALQKALSAESKRAARYGNEGAQEVFEMFSKGYTPQGIRANIDNILANETVHPAYAKKMEKAYEKGMEIISNNRGGSLYKVDLPDEAIAKMLDWDKPLSQQAPEVQKAVTDGMKKHKWPQSTIDDVMKNANGQQALNYLMPSGNRSQASDTLRDFGAPGIRYLDGGSRGAGEGTRNFVVFPGNEGLLKILDRQ